MFSLARKLLVSVALPLAACGSDPAPPAPVAGSAAVSGGAGVGTGTPAAGTGMIPSGVGTAGTPAAGSGTAGMPSAGTGTAGTSVAGTGAAGMGVAGMGAAGSSAAGAGVAGMGAAGMPAFTPGSPTFSAIYQEIIVGTGCNGGPTCHASTVAGGLKMTSLAEAYTALVDAPAAGMNLVMNGTPNCKDVMATRVVPGDPMASLFYDKVANAMPECGTQMPPGGGLAAEKVEQIRMWIMAGAKND